MIRVILKMLPLLFFITVVVLAGTFAAVVTVFYSKRKWWIFLFATLIAVPTWTFDPMVWRVHHRYPNAVITDCHDWFFLPAFLHAYITPSDSLYGGYLEVELTNESVDLSKFRDVPFFLMSLKHCRVVGPLYRGENVFIGSKGAHEDIMFQDCDFSGVQAVQSMGLKDIHHVTYETDPV